MKNWLRIGRRQRKKGKSRQRNNLERREMLIPADKVRLGMRVTRLDRPWEETPFLFQGFIVNRPAEIEQLKSCCEQVYIDALKDRWTQEEYLKALDIETTEPPVKRSFMQELPRSINAYRNLKTTFLEALEHVRQEDAIEIGPIKPVVDQCVESIIANPSALFWLTRIKNSDQYTAEHSLRVCILAVSLGRHLGYSRKRLELLGLSALLHDVGKMKVPDAILNKPGKLTEEEMEVMRKHAEYGADMIARKRGLPEIISLVARHHHETISGEGYPAGLHGNQIPSLARLVSIVDAYDAMTSRRCYKPSMPSMEALSILYNGRGHHFDAPMVEAFIRIVGLYPPGSLVEMKTGEVAIVVHTNLSRLRPTVMLQLNAEKKPVPRQELDLSEEENHHYTIVRSLPNDAYGLNVSHLIESMSEIPLPH